MEGHAKGIGDGSAPASKAARHGKEDPQEGSPGTPVAMPSTSDSAAPGTPPASPHADLGNNDAHALPGGSSKRFASIPEESPEDGDGIPELNEDNISDEDMIGETEED